MDSLAPEEMAAVLRAPNQLCYYVVFFVLFVTYLVHNVSATVSYSKKKILNIRTAITHLGIDKDFFLKKARAQGILQGQQGQHPHYMQEEETEAQGTQSGVPRKNPQKVSGKAVVTVNITRQRAIIGQ